MIVLVDENIPLLSESLSACSEVRRFSGRSLDKTILSDSGAKALIVRSTTKVNNALLGGSEIEFIGTATSGTDHVDKDYLLSKNIAFADAPGANANSVAEFLVYSIAKWAVEKKIEPYGMKIGIIGFGNIGRIVARYAYFMGLEPLINDPPLLEEGYPFPGYIRYASPEEICRECKIITNHVPLFKEGPYPTYHLLDSERIGLIPNGALLIHASRGGVVDEKAMLQRLKSNELTASIDVWEGEPLINTELAAKCIIATPHVAGYSRDGKIRGSQQMAEAFAESFGLKPDMHGFAQEMADYTEMEPAKFRNIKMLYEKLKISRRLDKDTCKLLETLGLRDDERAKAFDMMRKQYPVRREIL